MDMFRVGGLEGSVRAGGDDRRVLLLHGGPGMSDYMGWLADDLPGWTCATFQQRGLAPSTTDGPFDVATAVADVAAVLEHLADAGWERPLVVGHSWGGYLAWQVAARLGDRVGGVLTVDPMGAAGDMGLPAFEAELRGRLPAAALARLQELDRKEETAGLTDAEDREALGLYWPGYFADPASAPPMLDVRTRWDVFEQLMASVFDEQAELLRLLTASSVAVGALAGAASPMPASAAADTCALVSGGWTTVVPDAGHFLWHEAPGVVAEALERLRRSGPAGP